jgi:ADP-ribose 1''-phosphate phosphatase
MGDASGGARHFKQTKLSFFKPASKSQPPRTTATASDEHQGSPATVANAATNEADNSSETASDVDEAPAPVPEKDAKHDSEEHHEQPSPAAPPPPATTQTPPTTTTTTPTTPSRIRITDRTGDLFAAPPQTLLIHACNTIGSWGGGIALAFRNLYPAEFQIYRAHCARSSPNQLLGTALLIPPQKKGGAGRGGHWIGCLFTSRRYGRAKDAPGVILRATGPAMRDLMRLVVEEEVRRGVGVVGEVRMCRINGGLFAVPWERRKRAIEEMELGEGEVPGCGRDGVVEVVAWERE